MAKFVRKNNVKEKFEMVIDDEKFSITTRKMSTPEMLEMAAFGASLQDEMAKTGNRLGSSIYQKLIQNIIDFVVDIEGLVDEAGEEIKFDDMSEEHLQDLFEMCDIGSITNLYSKLSEVGRLKPDEKKV
jgi:hypothetical protein